jgi:hypothetical protein
VTCCAAEYLEWTDGKRVMGTPTFKLRPETLERLACLRKRCIDLIGTSSLFWLFRATRDEEYRDLAWKIFQAIEKFCKVVLHAWRTTSPVADPRQVPTGGYQSLTNVSNLGVQPAGAMESWFLAETLKYLFLIFGANDPFPPSAFVITTEAHTLGVLPR